MYHNSISMYTQADYIFYSHVISTWWRQISNGYKNEAVIIRWRAEVPTGSTPSSNMISKCQVNIQFELIWIVCYFVSFTTSSYCPYTHVFTISRFVVLIQVIYWLVLASACLINANSVADRSDAGIYITYTKLTFCCRTDYRCAFWFDFLGKFLKKKIDDGIDEIIGGTTVARGQHQYMV